MKRFILLYRGDPHSDDVDARVRSTPGLTIVDHQQDRLWLVLAEETQLREAFGNLAGWSISEERSFDLLSDRSLPE